MRILRALVDIYPDRMAKDVLGSTAGASLTSSTFANNLGRLRTLC
jgi:hypothetical protein